MGIGVICIEQLNVLSTLIWKGMKEMYNNLIMYFDIKYM